MLVAAGRWTRCTWGRGQRRRAAPGAEGRGDALHLGQRAELPEVSTGAQLMIIITG
jgi:hypothetical protein